jgi:ABC-type Fe3+-hydroxamate transport system substrate-binding protein
MKIIKDQLDRSINLTNIPQRIISLVPSQTEYLHDLGLENEVVGITKFCVHPNNWFRNKTRIGGTKQYHFDRIAELKPDLIIANKEENDKTQIEALAKIYPVWLSDIYTFEDAINMMQSIGNLVNRTEKATEIIHNIINKKQQFETKRDQLLNNRSPLKAAYFIWRKPYMIAANDTYINEMLKIFGVQNAFQHLNRYPEVQLEQLKNLEIDILFLSSEPYPFKEKHFEEFQAILPNTKIIIVDGEMFSWYGTRMLKTFDYFEKLLMTSLVSS